MGVRVRFAPSPTGLLHLGGARTALFNHLFASAHKGQCILRIEDTDKSRLVPGAREGLEKTLRWLGVQFHESPSKGGPFGPYIQSERLSIYQQYARELLKRGSGYPCFCSKERLQSLRQQGLTGYDRRCRMLSSRQANEEMNRGTPFTVRLKVPESGVVCVEDGVYGRVEVKSSSIEDQVLLKTDGFPTYHLACVVDDHTMEISHVLRGEEWLLSTAKHLLLYSSLGWSSPQFAHLPLLVSSTGEKLSKRLQGTSVQSYRERGFLSEAVAEFLCQLGWSREEGGEGGGGGGGGGGEEERERGEEEGEGGGGGGGESLEELASQFSLSRVSRSPARVDEGKLMWINKKHYRRRLHDPASSAELAKDLAERVNTTLRVPHDSSTLGQEYLLQVLQLLEDRICLIPRVPVEAPYFWISPNTTRDSIPSPDLAVGVFEELRGRLEVCSEFSSECVSECLKRASASLGLPYRVTMSICRASIVGQESSPGLAGVCSVLGKDRVLERLKQTARELQQ